MVSASVALTAEHDIAEFQCTKPALDHWLKSRALRNQEKGFTVVMVTCDGNRVVGYYGLAPTAVARVPCPVATHRTATRPDSLPFTRPTGDRSTLCPTGYRNRTAAPCLELLPESGQHDRRSCRVGQRGGQGRREVLAQQRLSGLARRSIYLVPLSCRYCSLCRRSGRKNQGVMRSSSPALS